MGGGAHLTKPGWSKPHTHSNPTNLALFRRKIALYRLNQGAHTIAGGSRPPPTPSPLILTTGGGASGITNHRVGFRVYSAVVAVWFHVCCYRNARDTRAVDTAVESSSFGAQRGDQQARNTTQQNIHHYSATAALPASPHERHGHQLSEVDNGRTAVA